MSLWGPRTDIAGDDEPERGYGCVITFLVWTLGVFLFVVGYVLWRRARTGRREQFALRLTVLFLAFGLLPAVPTVFLFTNAMNEIATALTVPGVEEAIRGAIQALQEGEREAERQAVEILLRSGPRLCLADSTILWVAELADSASRQPVRVWGDVTAAAAYFAGANASEAGLSEGEILRIIRQPREDGHWWAICRRYPTGVARSLLELRRSLRAYGTLALLRESVIREQVLWALGASLVAVLAVLAVVAARTTARRIAQPIAQLSQAMHKVANGQLDVSVPESGDEEIATLARAFNRMIAELRESRERLARTQRLAAWRDVARQVSHEIRNALTPAQITLHRLRKRLEGAQGEHEELLRSVEGQMAVLARLATSFSQLGKLPEPHFEDTDINALVHEVVALFEAEVHGLRFILQAEQDLPAVKVDKDRIRQVLNNILRNAVEASRPRSSIWIRTRRSSLPEYRVEIEIRDEGQGMPPESLAAAFKPYFTTKPGGTGLGLFIVKQIVDEHGGRIGLESQPGIGTSVRVWLP